MSDSQYALLVAPFAAVVAWGACMAIGQRGIARRFGAVAGGAMFLVMKMFG